MQLSHTLFLVTVVIALSSIFATYYGFFMTTIKFTKSSELNLLDKDNKTWFDQKVQVIMLVIDGLRFDYLAYNESNVGHEKFAYQNKFKNLHRIFTENPENYVIMRAFADPPSWTWERIPGFVTGNIPPKAGMFQTTAASRLDEDTVLRELRLAKNNTSKAYHAGDPLWTDYFPDDLISVTDIEGMNLKDAEVDPTTMSRIKEIVLNKEFDLIVGHTLAVDHAGHVFGIINPAVGRNIAVIDKLVANLIEVMNNNTMLIVLGDHGMTPEGTHGRSSPEETNTGIVAYHKKGFQKYKEKGMSKLMRSINETDLQVKQQDVAATLAMLLGVPIPYSNMGQILNDLYPIGNYLEEQPCEGAAFLTKMLNENHLNTLQILQYYKDFQQQTRQFLEWQNKDILNMGDETLALYKEATDMIKQAQQCKDSFKDKVTSAILKSQAFSAKVYERMLNSGSYDISVVLQAMATTILVIVAYALIIQFLYRHGYEKENDRINTLSQVLKTLMAPAVLTIVLVVVMWMLDSHPSHFVATITLFLALWLIGKLSVFLFKDTLQQPLSPSSNEGLPLVANSEKSDLNDKSPIGDSDTDQIEVNIPEQDKAKTCSTCANCPKQTNSIVRNILTLFIFRPPIYSFLSLVLIVGLIYCLHQSVIEVTNVHYMWPYGPMVAMVMIVGRVCRNLPRNAYYVLLIASVISCKVAAMKGIEFRDDLMLKNILALLLLFDWIWTETKYLTSELQVSSIWRYLQISCFLVLTAYHMLYMTNKESYWVEILLPRVVWGLILCAIALKNCFKIQGLATKRNIQLCLIQFLFLLQDDKQVFPFAFVLSLMRITLYLFEKVKPVNYLYPIITVFWSYFGLFTLEHSDRWIPMDFRVGFIGLHQFNTVLSSLMVFMSITTSFILGMLFISYYNENVDQQEIETVQTTVFASVGNSKVPVLIINPRVIKLRNIICYVFVISIVYFGAAIKCLAWKDYFLWEARQKFLMDSFIYMFIMGWGSLALLF